MKEYPHIQHGEARLAATSCTREPKDRPTVLERGPWFAKVAAWTGRSVRRSSVSSVSSACSVSSGSSASSGASAWRTFLVGGLILAASALVPSGAAAAAADTPAAAAGAGEVVKLQAEVERLKQDLREQRQLIFQLMQAEQQRYDVILKYLQSGGGSGPGADASAFPSPPNPASASAKGASAPDAKDGLGGAPRERESATVTGRVRSNGPVGEAYVYVDGMRGSPVRGHTVEIKQRDKQFSPRVAVVPLGTRLIFPNADTVIHNVFSTAPGNAFDLGSVKGGETSAPVVLLKPGPVEIFCNIHSKMRADILVVPNSHWTRVSADGSFQLPNVPLGTRKIVLWSPTLKPSSQQVDVTAKGGTAAFAPEALASPPHLNKQGRAYGSYDE
jgi:plastocyanin